MARRTSWPVEYNIDAMPVWSYSSGISSTRGRENEFHVSRHRPSEPLDGDKDCSAERGAFLRNSLVFQVRQPLGGQVYAWSYSLD